jgi:hypothetical protein
MAKMEASTGFLIVKTYCKLYKDHVNRYSLSHDLYAIPRIDRKPEDYCIQYRGIDRDAWNPYSDKDKLANNRMLMLTEKKYGWLDFLFDLNSSQSVLDLIEDKRDHEIIWVKTIMSQSVPPNNFFSVGFEPTYFTGDHFSALCDCMLFPRWHGTDPEGILFSEHFKKLNQYGLFNSADDAVEFLDYYLSFEWTEAGEYEIAEIFIHI